MQSSLTVDLFPSPVLKVSYLFWFVLINMLKFSTFANAAQVKKMLSIGFLGINSIEKQLRLRYE